MNNPQIFTDILAALNLAKKLPFFRTIQRVLSILHKSFEINLVGKIVHVLAFITGFL